MCASVYTQLYFTIYGGRHWWWALRPDFEQRGTAPLAPIWSSHCWALFYIYHYQSRGWALDKVHNSRRPLDRLQYVLQFVTLWHWPLTFWPNINWWARYRDGLTLSWVWWLYFQLFCSVVWTNTQTIFFDIVAHFGAFWRLYSVAFIFFCYSSSSSFIIIIIIIIIILFVL